MRENLSLFHEINPKGIKKRDSKIERIAHGITPT